jgi:hypothetical protein
MWLFCGWTIHQGTAELLSISIRYGKWKCKRSIEQKERYNQPSRNVVFRMWRVKFRMWIFFTICVHSWSQMGTVGDGSMDRYRWYLLTLSIDTFSLIFIDVIDPSVKDFFFWSIVLTIDHKSLLWPMAIDPTVHTESIVLINRSNCSKNLPNFRRFLPWRRKNSQLFLKNYFYFNKIIEGFLAINQLSVSIQSMYFLPAVPNYVHDRARKFDWIHYLAL